MLSNSESDHFESRGADVGPERWSHQGTALSHLNPHRKCLRGDAVLTVIWGHRIQDGSRLYKELTHGGKKACKQEQEFFTLWAEPVPETQKDDPGRPPEVHTGLCF
ncbi:Asc-Type Amino Acid Transporter 1 [Manis pentadactyla]|nr:Asc-Type Amino Acid Transporter 1 [Manis pentadactyla]